MSQNVVMLSISLFKLKGEISECDDKFNEVSLDQFQTLARTFQYYLGDGNNYSQGEILQIANYKLILFSFFLLLTQTFNSRHQNDRTDVDDYTSITANSWNGSIGQLRITASLHLALHY
jgi:hypothetical protein